MAKRSIARKRKKRNRKKWVSTLQAPLCALGEVLRVREVFQPIHDLVSIRQKTVVYRPTDKLVFVVLGMLSGAETVSEIQNKVRPDRGLLAAFGYQRCADASVIQQTLDASTEATVASLEAALAAVRLKQGQRHQVSLETEDEIRVDIDLSSLPIGKHAEGSEKGYVAKKPNTYTRQLARMVCGDTQEIFTQALYPGKTNSDAVFKPMLSKLETVLTLDTVEKRSRVRLRFDAGFGTDANINYALWRGYRLIGKMYNSCRIQKLVATVEAWVSVPTRKGIKGREAGWVQHPHRYARRTVQVAVRTPKKDGTWSYAVLVSTDTTATLADLVCEYDKRSGAPENSFCQDYQALSLRKYRKAGFIAQRVLLLLAELAHNLMIWMKTWFIEAIETPQDASEQTENAHRKATEMLQSRGLKRLRRDILALPGKVCVEGKKVVGIRINPLYPMITHVSTACEALFQQYEMLVLLDKT
jgi:hypothetical protein